ncbi:hypothetical protein D918_07276 [Trichuris suis]|nr:hypothetical protein D918_07276 [Trichuris suis]
MALLKLTLITDILYLYNVYLSIRYGTSSEQCGHGMTPLLDDVTAQYFLYSAFYGSCGCHCSSEEEVMEPTLMAMNFETINDMNRRYVVSLMNSCRLGENQDA